MYRITKILTLLTCHIVSSLSEDVSFTNVEVCVFAGQSKTCKKFNSNSLASLVADIAPYSKAPITSITVAGEVPVLYRGSISLGDSPQLIIINMINVSLRTIEPGAFDGVKRVSLYLASNQLQEIKQDVFKDVSGITELDLALNRISNIEPNAFSGMSDLQYIDLSHNKLKTWNSTWLVGSPVTVIQMSYNLVEELPPKAFRYLQEGGNDVADVIRIDFSSNRLTGLRGDMFQGLRKVDNIDMSNNKIENVEPDIFKDITIREFYLQGNKLTCIPKKHYEAVFKANLTVIFSNPWKRDCMDDMMEWEGSRRILLVQFID